MNIKVENLSKKYNQEWIFKDLSYHFLINNQYALLGNNGSGKSTALRILSGMQHATSGNIIYSNNNEKEISSEYVYQYISFTAPSMQLIEEMTMKEFFDFHFSLKKIRPNFNLEDNIQYAQLDLHYHKKLVEFSSGMKQKVKLLQAFGSNTPFLFLDEPCSNLDKTGIAFYHRLLCDNSSERIVIIASNDELEYPGISNHIIMEDYKKKITPI